MLQVVDRLFVRVRSIPFFLRLTLFTRILLAAGFIPTGMVKLLGRRFTVLSTDTPVGAFFEALYGSGGYWRFLGLSQVLAGVLLLFPRTAHLGALLFVPIMANIVAITVAMNFQGTQFVTPLMLLAVVYLCAWDYHRFRGLFTLRAWDPARPVPDPKLDRWERIGFQIFAGCFLGFLAAARNLFSGSLAVGLMFGAVAAGVFTLVRFLWAGRQLTPS